MFFVTSNKKSQNYCQNGKHQFQMKLTVFPGNFMHSSFKDYDRTLTKHQLQQKHGQGYEKYKIINLSMCRLLVLS